MLAAQCGLTVDGRRWTVGRLSSTVYRPPSTVRPQLREDRVANAVGGAGIRERFEENIGLAGTGEPGSAVVAYLDVGKELPALAGGDLIVNIPGY
jgi:hypothetical protein